jgi:hypothetical protein
MDENLAKQVIRAFGGLTGTHRATGWPISTIQGWGESGTIPDWRRDGLIAAAEREGVRLPTEFLAAAESASP